MSGNRSASTAVHPGTGRALRVDVVKLKQNQLGLKYAATHSRIRLNLLSVSQLVRGGCEVHFGGTHGASSIVMPSGKVEEMTQKNGLYWVQVGFEDDAQAMVVSSMLEHQRKCHFWQTNCRVANCDACKLSKAQKPSHRKSRPGAYKATRIGQSVHFDHVGPIDVPSISGCRWLLNAIDDFSGWTESFPGALKTEAVEGLSTYAKMNGTPESVRTDRDPVFAEPRSAWKMYCGKNQIQPRHSAPYEPEQNGKEERFNRTLMGAIRAIMVGVDKRLWPYAAKCASYIWNRVDHRRQKSPYFLRYGREPGLNHIRKFGCMCWMRVHQRRKMGDQYRAAVFLGYDSESPAYMVGYATKNGAMAVAVCSDVKFDENRTVSDLK